jgi:hypothetical protein
VLNTWLETNYNKIPHHNYVLYPDYLSLAALPESYKDKIRDYYKDKLHEWQRNELYAKLMIEHDPKLLTKASQFINAVDKARTLSYKDYIPELGEIL